MRGGIQGGMGVKRQRCAGMALVSRTVWAIIQKARSKAHPHCVEVGQTPNYLFEWLRYSEAESTGRVPVNERESLPAAI